MYIREIELLGCQNYQMAFVKYRLYFDIEQYNRIRK